MNELTVGPGTRVTLYFSLSLEDGTEVDSNYGGNSACFDFGDGNLLPGFEEALTGMKEGETAVLDILPEDGFGPHNPSNIQSVKREEFPDNLVLREGVVVTFQDAANNEMPGVIAKVDSDSVTVDFNHPLAGRVISFSVHILSVVPSVTH